MILLDHNMIVFAVLLAKLTYPCHTE